MTANFGRLIFKKSVRYIVPAFAIERESNREAQGTRLPWLSCFGRAGENGGKASISFNPGKRWL